MIDVRSLEVENKTVYVMLTARCNQQQIPRDTWASKAILCGDSRRTSLCFNTNSASSVLELQVSGSAFLFFNFYWSIVALQYFLLYSKVNQSYVYIHALFFGFPSHLGYHGVLSRDPCATQQILTSYLFHT